jgi:hypothetical protein
MLDTMHPQSLINTGMAWMLEGHVGRTCMALIEGGQAILGPEGHRDYWGNYVPSREEVEPGTKGSLDYANRLHGTTYTADDFDNGTAYADLLEGDDYE